MKFEEVKLACFIMFTVIVFLGLWYPYIRKVMKNIWKVKGMLNMIPTSHIYENK